MTVVRKISDYRPPQEAVEHKVASLDDGYMRIATSISKLKPKLKMAGREHQVFDAVIYCTFGWNKSEDRVTNTYLAEVTDLDDSDVAAALKVLAERRIINLRKSGGLKLVSVNVKLAEWQLFKSVKTTSKKLGGSAQNVGQKKESGWAKLPDTLNSLTQDNNKTPLTPQGGESDLAQECLDFYNLTTDSRCSSTAPFEKALSTVKAKGVCYSTDEVKLVTEWAFKVWKNKPSPNNLCRMTRFDTYLSDALKWKDGADRNPAPCPHDQLVSLWNAKFPERTIEVHEWNKNRPAYHGLERIWNGKTNQGAWREVKHIDTLFNLIRKSTLLDNLHEKYWLNIDWILDNRNWAKVYEQVLREYKESKQGAPA